MTSKQVVQQALEALEGVLDKHEGLSTQFWSCSGGVYEAVACNEAIEALKAALSQQGEQRCDTARVLEWMRTPNRKAAQFAFTEGQERQAAYWIEIAQSEPAALPIAQPDARKVIEQMVVALEIAERHLAYVEITEAREAGQQWLEENK